MSPEFERLVGRAVSDKAFRDKLLVDPEQAAKDAGFKISDAEMKQLTEGIKQVNQRMTPGGIDQIFSAAGSKWYS